MKAVLLPLAIAFFLAGCGASAAEEARIALGVSTASLLAVDDYVADKYEAEAERGGNLSLLDRVVDALRVSMAAMLAAQITLETWERDGDDVPFLQRLTCWLGTLSVLRSAAEAAHLNIPLPDDIEAFLPEDRLACPEAL